ncbi:MAG: tryptophan synthase subunit alpha [Rhizobiales bacterium]|nr:tryptophan synthase subunit alpha [Hyphomicrobiales bacterium]
MTNFTTRLDAKFEQCKAEGRSALNCFVAAGDPNYDDSLKILITIADAGADIIEFGMPFSDPAAEGPTIQLAHQRALASNQTLAKTLQLVREFRKVNQDVPIVLMGYYNPIYKMGCGDFLAQAREAGVDGLIIVDLPPEADDELCLPAIENGINFIRLATPTTDAKRLPKVLQNTSGFLYYVSINGITGTVTPDFLVVEKALIPIKAATDLPIAVGFGVKTPEQAAIIAKFADGVVVGSALVNIIPSTIDENGKATDETFEQLTKLTTALKQAIIEAR